MTDVLFADFFLASGRLDVVLVMRLMSEALESGTDAVLLAHFEVLTEVLVPTPPRQMHHLRVLIAAHLVEVRISHELFLQILGHSVLGARGSV